MQMNGQDALKRLVGEALSSTKAWQPTDSAEGFFLLVLCGNERAHEADKQHKIYHILPGEGSKNQKSLRCLWALWVR